MGAENTAIKRSVGRPRAIEKNTDLSTREEILAVSAKLFVTHGFKGTTTRMIADGVGIRQPSLFNHFRKKGEILSALVNEAASDLFVFYETLDFGSKNWSQLLFELVQFDVRFLMTEPYGIKQILALPEVKNSELQLIVAEKYEEVFQLYQNILQGGADASDFHVEDVNIAVTAILGMVESVWLLQDEEANPDIVSSAIAKMALRSVHK